MTNSYKQSFDDFSDTRIALNVGHAISNYTHPQLEICQNIGGFFFILRWTGKEPTNYKDKPQIFSKL